MDWLQALLLGIVQGLAEYLPISSSGHLEISRQILGIDLSGAKSLEFDVMLHVATVLSTIVILWKEFLPLCKSFFTFRRDYNFYYVCKLIVSCIPVGIVGLCFKDFVEIFFNGNLTIVGICLCVTALLLAFAYFFRTSPLISATEHNRKEPYKPRDISWIDAIVIGCAQAVAVLPGLSRSGTTIATGILLGDDRAKVARFSFFMVIIPILGEALLDLKKIFIPSADTLVAAEPAASVGAIPLLVGFLASFIVGCLACRWMLNIVKKGKMVWFAIYCLVVGLLCIFF